MSNEELIGKRFGKLVVIEFAGKDSKRNRLWKCKCDCGKESSPRGSSLLLGSTVSCGCSRKEAFRITQIAAWKACRTHGMTKDLVFQSWVTMRHRCLNPKRNGYKDYGGRGIKPCQFIAESPKNLVDIIGPRESVLLSLDRKNNEIGYTCGQCPECLKNGWPMNIQWSNRKVQNRNRRDTVRIEYEGQMLTRGEIAEKLSKDYHWVRNNIG